MNNVIIGIYLFSLLFYLSGCFLKPTFFLKIALFAISLGFLGNLFLIIIHFSQTKRLPLTNTSETLLFAVTIIVLIFLIINYKNHLSATIGTLVSFVASLGLVSSVYLLRTPSMPLLPALQSKWLVYHVLSCIIAYCFFTMAFITAIMNLIKKDPVSTRIVHIMHRSICLGFLFLTLGIIMGSVWGKAAWGHWWNWDPKEVWALITWFIYAYYFHGRLSGSWLEKRLCWIAIVGFSACLFTYLGVNYFLSGLHSYA